MIDRQALLATATRLELETPGDPDSDLRSLHHPLAASLTLAALMAAGRAVSQIRRARDAEEPTYHLTAVQEALSMASRQVRLALELLEGAGLQLPPILLRAQHLVARQQVVAAQLSFTAAATPAQLREMQQLVLARLAVIRARRPAL